MFENSAHVWHGSKHFMCINSLNPHDTLLVRFAVIVSLLQREKLRPLLQRENCATFLEAAHLAGSRGREGHT